MPRQEGNEKSKSYHHEEWQAGNAGRMPILWHQDVQNWQELKPVFFRDYNYIRLDIS
jgi:hypothetical protein